MKGLIHKASVLMLCATLCACTCGLAACAGNANTVRQQLRNEAVYEYGVMRTVTAYSATGEKIGQWHGKIDVQYVCNAENGASERVDLVVFDGETAIDRIIISGAIVVVDND